MPAGGTASLSACPLEASLSARPLEALLEAVLLLRGGRVSNAAPDGVTSIDTDGATAAASAIFPRTMQHGHATEGGASALHRRRRH